MDLIAQPACCRYPIVLLHGLFGFVERRLGPIHLTYYRGVVPFLQRAGNRVYAFQVSPVKPVSVRANQLKEQIQAHPDLCNQPLNLIAHSMGGLDARYLINHLGMADQVRSLTTLATPHRGSSLANLLRSNVLFRYSTAWISALPDLITEGAVVFNEKTPNLEGVQYYSIPAQTRIPGCAIFMWPTYLYMYWKEGPNDGQVSVQSAEWGQVLKIAEMDHLQMVGLKARLTNTHRWDHLTHFAEITRILAAHGL